MAKRLYRYQVTVSGPSPFPVDMLRYDGLVPATENASNRIREAIEDTTPGPVHTIKLERQAEAGWMPEAGRWQSFRWRVDSVERL